MLACIFTHRDEAIFHHITLLFENKSPSQNEPTGKKLDQISLVLIKNSNNLDTCTQAKALTKGEFTFRVSARSFGGPAGGSAARPLILSRGNYLSAGAENTKRERGEG